MTDDDRFKLLFGPYKTLACQIGSTLFCQRLQRRVEVVEFTAAPIPWPRCQERGNKAIILCRGLARAVRRESSQAVAHHWGVSFQTVSAWRVALRASHAEVSR